MFDEWCQRDRSQVDSHRICARSNLMAEQRLSGTPDTRESCRRNSFTCMRRLYYHMVVPSECICCIDWRNAISLSSIDEFSPDRDFGSGFIAGAGRQLSVHAYCTLAAYVHASIRMSRSQFSKCELNAIKPCRDIGTVQLAGSVGRRRSRGDCVCLLHLSCGTDTMRRGIVSTNPRDVEMPRKMCMAAGPASMCTCSNQGMMLDVVRYLLLAMPWTNFTDQ
jgi:hypothetical protein